MNAALQVPAMFPLFKKSPPNAQPDAPRENSWFGRLKAGLSQTSSKMKSGLTTLWRRDKVDDAWYQELEDTLLMADVGPTATQRIIDTLRHDAKAATVTTDASGATVEAVKETKKRK